ncbi:MAG TPA: Hpt domain-containing protein [bacterium]
MTDYSIPGYSGNLQDFDYEDALDRVGGDVEFLRELIDLFIETSEGNIDELTRSLDHGDTDTSRRAAHTLKGAAGNVSASKVREIAAKIEEAISNGDMDIAESMVDPLKSEFDNLVIILKSTEFPDNEF